MSRNNLLLRLALMGLLAGASLARAENPDTTKPSVGTDGNPAVLRSPDAAARIDEAFRSWNSASTPGCAVGVARNGQRVLMRAYGSADLEHDVPNSTSTVFEAGSSSKQFTAAAILMLAEQHRLALSDDIRKYLPELPDYGDIITIDQLLNHTSGLRDWGAIELVAGWPRTTRAYTMNDVLGVIARQRELNYRPGTQYSYTNSGYSLLTIIVERVSGQSLANFSLDHLFKPLGMTQTQWRDDFRRVVKNRAVAYQKTPDGYVQNMPFEDTYGHGGLLTTVGDLLTWNEALSSKRLGDFVTSRLQQHAVLSSGREIAYARGLFVADYHGVEEIAHPGATAGYRAWVGRYPQQGLSVAMLCNASEVDTVAFGRKTADVFLASTVPSAAPVALAPDKISPLSGQFVNELNGLPITLEGHEGNLQTREGASFKALSATTFRSDEEEIRFSSRDAFELFAPEEIARYSRVPSYSPTLRDLQQRAGIYVSDEAEATYVLTVEDGQLVMTLKSRPEMAVLLTPAYPDAYSIDGGVVILRPDGNGRISELLLSVGRVRGLRFRRAG